MVWNNMAEKKDSVKGAVRSKIVEMRSQAQKSSSAGSGKQKPEPEDEPATDKNRDVSSGMELLELDFLLGVIEDTEGNDPNDVTMRRLDFNEVLRRSKQDQIESNALTVYAVNKGDLYGKTIQCEAMKELTKRTAK